MCASVRQILAEHAAWCYDGAGFEVRQTHALGGVANGRAHGAAGWQAEWHKTLAAAKQEGLVAVMIPPGDTTRAALVDAFDKVYPGITVDAETTLDSAAAAPLT